MTDTANMNTLTGTSNSNAVASNCAITAATPTITTTTTSRIPVLAPTAMVPRRTSRTPLPSALLNTIDAVEINHTVERDGVTYYVLDVYLKRFTSRIPTNVQREKQLKQQQFESYRQQQQQTEAHRAPDYQLEKRFSDFADLRYRVWTHAQKQSETACAFSSAFMDFIVHRLAQPRLLVRLATTTSMRKPLLATFCNEFLRLATLSGSDARDAHTSACETRHAVPILLERFFRKQEGDNVAATQQQ